MHLPFIMRCEEIKMVFSSATFLFAFLPIVIGGYFILKESYRNVWLLLASLVFYAWSKPEFLWILLVSICLNYCGALLIDFGKTKGFKYNRLILAAVVALNLLLLGYFKYFNFTLEIINDIFGTQLLGKVILPIGISFFTFQGMSYVIDVWRDETPVQKNWILFAMYVSMFPQLVAGPIVRYKDINRQIAQRSINTQSFAEGLSRFIIGLFRKVIIADSLAKVADPIFALDADFRTAILAWIGIVAYTLQIYFDFSGYSDMAIGLGKMLGFSFVENFNFPYISKSITEFWRRWHISLSSFFRDYVYIPLGGNRKAVYRNIVIVFLLTGIWHGAAYTFILWGIWHGIFNIAERIIRKTGEKKRLLIKESSQSDAASIKGCLKNSAAHIYTMLVVMLGWVLFRAATLGDALSYLKAMFGLAHASGMPFSWNYFVHGDTIIVLVTALIWSTPFIRKIGEIIKDNLKETYYLCTKYFGLILMLGICMIRIAANTYSAFIYFQF